MDGNKSKEKEKTITCGLVMPISAIDGCSAEHWGEVKNIVCEAVEAISEPKFTVRLVSDADDVGVIQKRIVQNIYSSDIIVCDVSGKNPNVMFELGMRLAFDKPTVIIKDDKTDYSFDTGVIEHISYPRDLRFSRIVTFKAALVEKISATHKAATTNPEHSTFLKNFGKFQVASLSETVVPADKVVLEMLQDLQSEVSRIRRSGIRESSRRGSSTNTAVVAAALNAYRNEKRGTKLTDLVGSEDFYREMESIADAPRYFDGPGEFREAVEDFLRQSIRIEQRSE